MICPPPPLCRCGCGEVPTYNKFSSRYASNGGYSYFRKGHSNRLRKYPTGKDNPTYGEKNGMWGRFGEKNPNWCGGFGKQEGNQTGRLGAEHKAWRKAVFERDDFTCWDCGTKGGKLNAHHLKSWANYPDLRFTLTNGITVCEDPCHKIRTKRDWGR